MTMDDKTVTAERKLFTDAHRALLAAARSDMFGRLCGGRVSALHGARLSDALESLATIVGALEIEALGDHT